MESRVDNGLHDLSSAKVVEIFTWAANGRVILGTVDLLRRSSVSEIDVIPLHGNDSAIETILAASGRVVSDTFIRSDKMPKLYAIEECQLKPPVANDEAAHSTKCRIIISGKGNEIEKPAGIEYLDKIWDWPDIFFNIIQSFSFPVSPERSRECSILPKELMVQDLKEKLGIADALDARIAFDEIVHAGILEEVGYEEYRFSFHNPKKYYCMNWTGRTAVKTNETPSIDKHIPHLLSLLNRTPHLESREYLELLNYLDLLRLVDWKAIGERSDPKLLIDLHYVLANLIDWHIGSYEHEERAKCYLEFQASRRVYLADIRKAIYACKDSGSPTAHAFCDILCEVKWTLTGKTEIDDRVKHVAADWFCQKSILIDDTGTLHVPDILQNVIMEKPFSEMLASKLAKSTSTSFYRLHIQLF